MNSLTITLLLVIAVITAIASLALALALAAAQDGYENESGFHRGSPSLPVRPSVARVHAARTRKPRMPVAEPAY
jgi:hypothetical protein